MFSVSVHPVVIGDVYVEGGSGGRENSCYNNRPTVEKSFARGYSVF